MDQVRRAATAPARPSPQDMQVATQATRSEANARAELQSDAGETLSPEALAAPRGEFASRVEESYRLNTSGGRLFGAGRQIDLHA